MSSKVGDWVEERCSTIGAGNLILIGPTEPSQVSFAQTMPSGPVLYSIKDGINRETGIGNYNGGNTIVRSNVKANLFEGIYNEVEPSPIPLSGFAVVSCTLTADSYNLVSEGVEDMASAVQQNSEDILENSNALVVNTYNIAQNTSDITDNTSAILQNSSNISQNSTVISTNSANIETNTLELIDVNSDILDNANLIAINAADITQNAADILVNVGAIDQNAADIIAIGDGGGDQALLIQANTDNIAINAADILINAGDIDQNAADIIAVDDIVDDHALLIQGNTDSIAINAAGIVSVDTDVSFRESAMTALENGGYVSINGATSVLIASGNGEIIDSYTDPTEQATKDVSWPEHSFNLLANGGMPVTDGIGVTDIAIDQFGATRAYPNGMGASVRRISIRMARVEYLNRVITTVVFAPIISNSIGNTLFDYFGYQGITQTIKGLVLRPTTIGDLSTWRDSGSVFFPGANIAVSKSNPNVLGIVSIGSETIPLNMSYITYNNGNTTIVAVAQPLVPNDAWEEGGNGIVEPLTNGHSVIHYMYQSLGGEFYLLYGQKEYTSFDDAISNLYSDASSIQVPVELGGMVKLAQCIVAKGAALGWDNISAAIYPTGSAVSSTSGGGESSQAVNISYEDTYGLGTNVQTALDSLGGVMPTPNQSAAMNGANVPSDTNVFATIVDIPTVFPTPPHDDLDGLDGGVASEYFHLTSPEYDAVLASTLPSASNPFVTESEIPAGVVVPDHDDLEGLDGGEIGSYYHLTGSEYDAISAATLPSTSNPFVTEDDLPEGVVVPDHNDLDGLDGGEVGAYYHIPSDEYLALIAANAPALGNPFATIADVPTSITIPDHNDLEGLDGGAVDAYFHTTLSENNAITGANSPSTNNVFATMNDLGGGGVTDHTELTSIGVNTHDEIDDHINDVSTNPHGIDKVTMGLGNVDNTSDALKPISNATQSALNGKASTDFNMRGRVSGTILYLTTDGSQP